jgi:hypothetical protein
VAGWQVAGWQVANQLGKFGLVSWLVWFGLVWFGWLVRLVGLVGLDCKVDIQTTCNNMKTVNNKYVRATRNAQTLVVAQSGPGEHMQHIQRVDYQKGDIVTYNLGRGCVVGTFLSFAAFLQAKNAKKANARSGEVNMSNTPGAPGAPGTNNTLNTPATPTTPTTPDMVLAELQTPSGGIIMVQLFRLQRIDVVPGDSLNDTCVICLDKPAVVSLWHHANMCTCLCKHCFGVLRHAGLAGLTCPLCRQPVQKVIIPK